MKHLHVVVLKAPAGRLQPAIELSLTRVDVQRLGTEDLDLTARFSRSLKKRIKDQGGVAFVHLGATVECQYFHARLPPHIWK
jgi:hypothetical protein